MSWILGADEPIVDLANTVIAVSGLCVGLIALYLARHSNQTAREANTLSRSANDLAAKAIAMQEDESRVRLIVKPRMLCVLGDGEDSRPRPVVEVINLSAFPVTITKICWRDCRDGWFNWTNPAITAPFCELPARLPPREALTALGIPTAFKSLEELQAVTAAVVFTACGEQVAGMTQDWQDDVRHMIQEA